jgi:Xaa-Pro aminopeptidase
MKHARSGIYEYQLEAYFDYEIKTNGATGYTFKTIAGSGVNGAILHYVSNDSLIEDDSLILFDLGAQYKLYNADITRTFPVSGKFTNRQKEIYEIVLNGQELVFKHIKPGVTLMELNNILKEYYVKELTRIGLIKEDKELINYYFHGVSHHLGLDTHDVSFRDMKLAPGMVITDEPGLYFAEHGIGVRIEDDLLITESGCEVLSKDIIKEVKDIEMFMGKK